MQPDFFDVVSLELAMLVITVRLFERDRNNIEHVRGLLEDVVHLFKRAVTCLRVEKVHDRENNGVADTGQLRTRSE